MPAMDYSDETMMKVELQKLVFREMAATFDDLDRAQEELEAAAAGLEGPPKEALEEKLLTVGEAKLEAIQLFKAMHDFLA